MFVADKKHTFSPNDGHIISVNTLKSINAFGQIFINCKNTNFELYSIVKSSLREYAFYIDLIDNNLSFELQRVSEKPKRIQEIVTIFTAVNSAKQVKTRTQIREYLVKFFLIWDRVEQLVSNKRIKKQYKKLKNKNYPFTVSQLNISAKDLIELGYSNSQISKQLTLLWQACLKKPKLNDKQKLLALAKKYKSFQ